MKACAVAVSSKTSVIAEYRELLRQRVVEVETPAGNEQLAIPEYGRTVKCSERLPRSDWLPGEKVTDFVTRVLGPAPDI